MTIKAIVPSVGRRYNPFWSLDRDVDSLLGSLLRRTYGDTVDAGEGVSFAPRMDVRETDKAVTVSLALPGVDEKDVNVEFDDNVLTISGERKTEEKKEDENWCRIEQSYGAFSRSIALPDSVNGDKATAEYARGVLQVTVPKQPEKKAKKRKISIASK